MTAPKPPEKEHPPGPDPGIPVRLARAGRVRSPGAVVRSRGPIPSGLLAAPLDRGSAMAAPRVRERVRLRLPGSGAGAACPGKPARLDRAGLVGTLGPDAVIVRPGGPAPLGLRSVAACPGQPVPLARGALTGAPGPGGGGGRFGSSVSVCLSGGL